MKRDVTVLTLLLFVLLSVMVWIALSRIGTLEASVVMKERVWVMAWPEIKEPRYESQLNAKTSDGSWISFPSWTDPDGITWCQQTGNVWARCPWQRRATQ